MVKPEPDNLNPHTLDRLMHYYHCLHEYCGAEQETVISSTQLAGMLSLDDSQIRKDLAAIGVKGHCHVGFGVREVMETIRRVVGVAQRHPAVVVGAGRLGGALASYRGFADYGLAVVALFDHDPAKIGLIIGGHVVQPVDQLERILQAAHVRLGILTVPAEAAQECALRLVHAGVKVLWNFSPARLSLGAHVFVRHEHLFVGLGQLFYHLKTAPAPFTGEGTE